MSNEHEMIAKVVPAAEKPAGSFEDDLSDLGGTIWRDLQDVAQRTNKLVTENPGAIASCLLVGPVTTFVGRELWRENRELVEGGVRAVLPVFEEVAGTIGEIVDTTNAGLRRAVAERPVTSVIEALGCLPSLFVHSLVDETLRRREQ